MTDAVSQQPTTPAATETPNAAPANPFAGSKHRVKIDNQETEVPYEELVAGYQRAGHANQRSREAAQLKAQSEAIINALRSGDLGSLKSYIPKEKLLEFSEKELLEYIKYEQLSDDAKARMEAERERDEAKKILKEREEEENLKKREAIELEAARELDLEISEAIKDLRQELGIDPKTPVEPWFVDHVARTMLAYLESDDEGAERVPAKTAAKQAWSGVEKTVRSYLESIPPEKALAVLPRSLRDAIRRADVGDAMTQMQKRISDNRQVDDTPPRKKGRALDMDEFFARRDRMFGG